MKVKERYLVTENNQPFLVHADTAWRVLMRLSLSDTEYYLDDRLVKKFNALHFHAIDLEGKTNTTLAGHHPFTNKDLTRPVEAYWQHADAVFHAAAERGFLLCISAQWFGAGGGGWLRYLTPENCYAYGHFLGERYSHLKDVLWIHSGDCSPYNGEQTLVRQTAAGIRSKAPRHLHTIHNAHEHASAFWYHDDPWCDVNMAYTYDFAYKQVLGERGREPTRPVYLGETGYEKNHSGGRSNVEPFDAAHVRRQAYWTLLSGAAGHAYGHAKIWCFADGWKDSLSDPGTRHMRYLREFFEAHSWSNLQPDLARPWLLEGGGQFGSAHYAATAITPDKKHALVYLPSAGAIKLDLDYFPSSPSARWFEPQTGNYYDVKAEAVMKPPLEADAVLVLES